MAKGEVVDTAKKIKGRKNIEKYLSIGLILLLLILTLTYFILNIVYNEGSFTISLDRNTYLRENLIMYESLNDRSSVFKLSTSRLEFMDNISVDWLPEDINKEGEGSHNGNNYIAYSFYLENQGSETLNYWYSITVDDVIKNIDEAARVMIIVNDEKTVYAKKSSFTGEAEPETTAFREDDTVIIEKRAGMTPEQIDKITIVIWLEGDDRECVNAILGGELKMHMDIYEEHIEERK